MINETIPEEETSTCLSEMVKYQTRVKQLEKELSDNKARQRKRNAVWHMENAQLRVQRETLLVTARASDAIVNIFRNAVKNRLHHAGKDDERTEKEFLSDLLQEDHVLEKQMAEVKTLLSAQLQGDQTLAEKENTKEALAAKATEPKIVAPVQLAGRKSPTLKYEWESSSTRLIEEAPTDMSTSDDPSHEKLNEEEKYPTPRQLRANPNQPCQIKPDTSFELNEISIVDMGDLLADNTENKTPTKKSTASSQVRTLPLVDPSVQSSTTALDHQPDEYLPLPAEIESPTSPGTKLLRAKLGQIERKGVHHGYLSYLTEDTTGMRKSYSTLQRRLFFLRHNHLEYYQVKKEDLDSRVRRPRRVKEGIELNRNVQLISGTQCDMLRIDDCQEDNALRYGFVLVTPKVRYHMFAANQLERDIWELAIRKVLPARLTPIKELPSPAPSDHASADISTTSTHRTPTKSGTRNAAQRSTHSRSPLAEMDGNRRRNIDDKDEIKNETTYAEKSRGWPPNKAKIVGQRSPDELTKATLSLIAESRPTTRTKWESLRSRSILQRFWFNITKIELNS